MATPVREAPVLDPDDLAEEVEFLSGATEEAFAEELVDFVTARSPEAELVAAFRSPEVVRRVAKTADRLLRDHGPLVKQEDNESRNAFTRRAGRARQAMELELRRAQLIIAGDAARATGHISAAPNPSNRARRRLAALHPEQYFQLKQEEEQKAAEARRAAKQQGRSARRQASRYTAA
ncbi:hypothetical protein [Kitasatospora sp. NPDC088548]|uniref:hypothetical protein n=1 Tax=Kitasatospora sp. NPDC088548 TaxID=3364075 RepID=UPI0037F5CA1A